MEHLHHFSQTVDNLSPSPADLSQEHTAQHKANQALIANVINVMSVALGPHPPQTLRGLRVTIPEHSMLGQWLAVYWKAVNRPAFLAWAQTLELDVSTLWLQGSRLQAHALPPGNAPLRTFTLADQSGWWQVSHPILTIAQVIDPGDIGLPYVADRITLVDRTLPLELTLAFHGYPLPDNRLQVEVIIDELRALDGFPGVDDSGQSKSVIHAELNSQQQDYQQLAQVFEHAQADEQPFDWFQPYRHRIVLRSDSMLANTMKQAARLLAAIIGTLDVDTAKPVYYYNYDRQALCPFPPSPENSARCTYPSRSRQWQELMRLAETLQTDVCLDESFSVAALLHTYGIARPLSDADLSQLIALLRQWSVPTTPYISESARSSVDAFIHRKYLGLLNDRYQMQGALQQACAGKLKPDPVVLDATVEMDPDVFGASLEEARTLLMELIEDADFIALRNAQGIDPSSHVLLTASGDINAQDLDGHWKPLRVQVLRNKRLAKLLPALFKVAGQTGGELRSHGDVRLDQAIRLYGMEVPLNAGEALNTAGLLAIPFLIRPQPTNYWHALTQSQPSRWTLSPNQKQKILDISRRFLPDPYTHLFHYLSEPILEGKSVPDIRAEADFLLGRLLASPRAQALARELSAHILWHGRDAGAVTTRASRNALVLAALILSVDPLPDARRNRIQQFDWSDSYYWSEPLEFVRTGIEFSLPGLDHSGSAPLATHLLLSGQAPEFLIRGIPGSMPFMTSRAWVVFKQYVAHTERELLGSSRQLSYDDFMTLVRLPPSPSLTRFISQPEATMPVIDWAVANGILVKKEAYSRTDLSKAISALNQQHGRLENMRSSLAKPFMSLYETALHDLQRVFARNTSLQEPVLEWLAGDGKVPQEQPYEQIPTGKKYSLVQVYMAGRLDALPSGWHSSHHNIQYAQMAKHFHQLDNLAIRFGEAFAQRLEQLQAAYVESITFKLSQLTLPRREALEYGDIECFGLSKMTRSSPQHGRFAVLVYVRHYRDQHFYEVFPLHHLVRPRRDLEYERVIQATTEGNAPKPHDWKRFDWPAYAEGSAPADPSLAALHPDVIISKLDVALPAVLPPPNGDEDTPSVPQTYHSTRVSGLATLIVQRQLLMGSTQLRESAGKPLTLEQAASRYDPWTEYIGKRVIPHT